MRVGRKLKKTAYLIINLIIQIYIFEFCKGFHSIISDQSPKYAVFPSNLILPKKSSVSGLFFEILTSFSNDLSFKNAPNL